MKTESIKGTDNNIGYVEYSIRQKCLHFNQYMNGGFRHSRSEDWEVIGLCTFDTGVKISMYCQDVLDNEGKFDIRHVRIAYELYKETE